MLIDTKKSASGYRTFRQIIATMFYEVTCNRFCKEAQSTFCHLFCLIGYNVFNSTVLLLSPFPNKPWFLRVCSTSLLKTLWEKKKLLVTSNFSFSRSVF